MDTCPSKSHLSIDDGVQFLLEFGNVNIPPLLPRLALMISSFLEQLTSKVLYHYVIFGTCQLIFDDHRALLLAVLDERQLIST
jgi:hypothetical protein